MYSALCWSGALRRILIIIIIIIIMTSIKDDFVPH